MPQILFYRKLSLGMNKNCKIIYNGNEVNAGKIMDSNYNDDKISINSNYTCKALIGNKNDLSSSVRSDDNMSL